MVKEEVLAADLERITSRLVPIWRELDGASVFITGATGFFGSWLLESALSAIDSLNVNITITALSRRRKESISNLAHLVNHPSITWLQGDITDFTFPEGPLSHVIHAAAEASSITHNLDPVSTLNTNVRGTERCLQLAKQRGASRFLYISSGAVYGAMTQNMAPPDESYLGAPSPLEVGTAYAQGKRAAEFLVSAASRAGLSTCIARCFAFVGPYQPSRSSFAITNFIQNALDGKIIDVSGDGTPLRSYLYASDLAEQLWTLLAKAPSGEAFNIGSEEAISIGELAFRVAAMLRARGVHVSQQRVHSKIAAQYVPNTQKAQRVLGLTQTVTLREAIYKTSTWMAHQDSRNLVLA